MYDIHYLRWTGYQRVDQILGVVGLSFVIILAFLGVFMFFQRKKITDKSM
jgi:apolipoprotein N-acyltransferase